MKCTTMLAPDYVEKFECIGANCEDNCCKDWSIQIDKKTYKRYRNVSDCQLKPILQKCIKRERTSNTDANYAKIVLNERRECPLITEGGLCSIHQKLGPKYLSQTCRIYPRHYNNVNNILEKSLTLSCPEVARKVLLNKNGIEFCFRENNEEFSSNRRVNTDTSDNVFTRRFLDLRSFIISALQDRNYTIEERLVIIGMFLNQINEENICEDEIQDTIEEYQSSMERLTFKDLLIDVEYNYKYNLDFIIQIHQKIIQYGGKPAYKQILIKTLEGLKIEDFNVNSSNLYKDTLRNRYKQFTDTYSYILENYLVNYVFKSLFLVDTKNTMDSFTDIAVKFALIKLNLIGIAIFEDRELSEEDAIKIIYSYTALIDHNKLVMNSVFEYLESNNFKTLAHMVMLIGE